MGISLKAGMPYEIHGPTFVPAYRMSMHRARWPIPGAPERSSTTLVRHQSQRGALTMGSIRIRPETGKLYVDFHYRGVRCREQTSFIDMPGDHRRAEMFLRNLQRAVESGAFSYADYFPNSPRVHQFDNQASPRDRTPVFREFAMTWIAEMTPQWSGIHLRTVREVMHKNLLPRFGDTSIGQITRTDVLSFRAELATLPGRKGTLGASRINKILCFLRQVLNEAASRFEFSPPFQGIKPLKMKRSDAKPFSLKEVQLLLDTVRPDYRNYLAVRFFTGLRTGEINGLRWQHVDSEHELILVRETLITGEVEEGAKTERSARDVPMSPMVRAAIDDQWAKRRPDCPWVFPTRTGHPIDAKNFNNRIWLPLLKDLGMAARRPYQTRHTAATLMLAAGENPEWIAMVLGHANTQMLFRVYSRFVPNLTRHDGQALASLLAEHLQLNATDVAA